MTFFNFLTEDQQAWRDNCFKFMEKQITRGRQIYIEGTSPEFHEVNATTATPLNQLPYDALTPGSKGLEKILSRFR